jgi:hypothetical protein
MMSCGTFALMEFGRLDLRARSGLALCDTLTWTCSSPGADMRKTSYVVTFILVSIILILVSPLSSSSHPR